MRPLGGLSPDIVRIWRPCCPQSCVTWSVTAAIALRPEPRQLRWARFGCRGAAVVTAGRVVIIRGIALNILIQRVPHAGTFTRGPLAIHTNIRISLDRDGPIGVTLQCHWVDARLGWKHPKRNPKAPANICNCAPGRMFPGGAPLGARPSTPAGNPHYCLPNYRANGDDRSIGCHIGCTPAQWIPCLLCLDVCRGNCSIALNLATHCRSSRSANSRLTTWLVFNFARAVAVGTTFPPGAIALIAICATSENIHSMPDTIAIRALEDSLFPLILVRVAGRA